MFLCRIWTSSWSRAKGSKEKADAPKVEIGYEPLRPLFSRDTPALVPASSLASADAALKVYRDQYSMNVVLYGLSGVRRQ